LLRLFKVSYVNSTSSSKYPNFYASIMTPYELLAGGRGRRNEFSCLYGDEGGPANCLGLSTLLLHSCTYYIRRIFLRKFLMFCVTLHLDFGICVHMYKCSVKAKADVNCYSACPCVHVSSLHIHLDIAHNSSSYSLIIIS